MPQPPVSGHGAGEEPGRDARLPGGFSGAAGVPSGPSSPGPSGASPSGPSGLSSSGSSGASGGQRDPRLAAFARHGAGDACPPGAGLGTVLDELSGPDRRCPGASDDELVGVLCAWDRLEAHMAARKHAAVAEFIR